MGLRFVCWGWILLVVVVSMDIGSIAVVVVGFPFRGLEGL